MTSFVFMAILAACNAAPADPEHAPQLASTGSLVGLAYGTEHGIWFRASRDAGKTFGDPVRVAEGQVVPVNRHRGPRISMHGAAIVITAVVGRTIDPGSHGHGLPSDGDLLAWRSSDEGKHWTGGVVINDVPGAAREGLHALASDAAGGLFAAWLDRREASDTRIFGARSADGGATWSRNILVYESPGGTVCECCHPSVAIDAGRNIYVMWRNCLGGARDMYIAQSADGERFTGTEKLGTGTWQLNACPMDGGGLTVYQGRVVTAWRRDRTVYLAEPGGRERAVGEGKDIALVAGARGVYVAWVGASGVEVRTPDSAIPCEVSTAGTLPALTRLSDGAILVAWEEGGAVRTKRIE